ncbi:response regulator transcription factor [Aneurinibacillus aneurinilyticus]|jgi:DNA-binding response OmpR family regulator|uniref:Response regulator transcription factor n=2 Tax=Aneurinibacillus aneurinilyticus TaxID=1391 RepID=A0A848D473_ANEAE|nr:response regulator transcription factor [Aneurinibacillus aneurinilyticus]ERI10309.1 response regulator receiver domain protein [Aneurinibacillus aneurinilyticus ATCC 12856]MCI1696109.1 response regulator transcription factor [Aneurinibacillus aneurinilyticus]MED0706823.1 response regulator transcription factor [Aneurinibacillus aneurinilyticus]MED0726544.1 response regulator transcription factor [Aneurinibacillus aneurinilyticus]MED0733296.1 response regulator transcription factor [Aneurin
MSRNINLLLVDDDREIRNLIEIYARNEGYTIFHAQDGLQAIQLVEKHSIDLIILDIMMPNMDGITACMKIRERKQMPIIILSAKNKDMDKITGLSTGADDYVTKPFNPLELIARIKSQLRRYHSFSSTTKNTDEIEIGELRIKESTHQVFVREQEIAMTRLEFMILHLLAQNRDRVFPIDQIYEAVWKEPSTQTANNTVMVHIRKIREKIEENPRQPRYIKTIWGVGYKIEACS